MDKNNCKLIILHKYINAEHTTNQSTHLLTAQTNKKTKATQKSLPFEKWRFREKDVRLEWAKSREGKTEIATGLGRRTREEI